MSMRTGFFVKATFLTCAIGDFSRIKRSVSTCGSSVYSPIPTVSTKHQSGISVANTMLAMSVTGFLNTAHLKSTPRFSTLICPTRCPPRKPPCDPPTTQIFSGSHSPSLTHRFATATQSATSRTPGPPPFVSIRLCKLFSPYPVLPR